MMQILNKIQQYAACLLNPLEYLTPSEDCKAKQQYIVDNVYTLKEVIEYGGRFDALKEYGTLIRNVISSEYRIWESQNTCRPPVTYQWGDWISQMPATLSNYRYF